MLRYSCHRVYNRNCSGLLHPFSLDDRYVCAEPVYQCVCAQYVNVISIHGAGSVAPVRAPLTLDLPFTQSVVSAVDWTVA